MGVGVSAPVIGLDLGTTNARVAVVLDDGTVEVIADALGRRSTPAMVGVTEDGEVCVGHDAASMIETGEAAYSVRRLIGRKWNSPAVGGALETVLYRLVEGPHHDVCAQLGGRAFSLPELSAYLLRHLKVIAERRLGCAVERCVVTVPASFGHSQRRATKDAARIAGFDDVRLVNEPTAAALDYARGRPDRRRIVVFRLGGGSFDASLVSTAEGGVEVLGTAGDTYLGGDDYGIRIIEWMVFGYLREQRIDLRHDRAALGHLVVEAERAKRMLSVEPCTEVRLTSGRGGSHVPRVLTEEKLERLVVDLTERLFQITEKVLREAGNESDTIDEVLLVGDATRLPQVKRVARAFFDRTPTHADSEASVRGAAVLAAAGEAPIVSDVTAQNLGAIEVVTFSQRYVPDGEGYRVLLGKGSPVVATVVSRFDKPSPALTSLRVMVQQGDAEDFWHNELLCELVIHGVGPCPVGEDCVDLTIELSEDGTIQYLPKDPKTGAPLTFDVTACSDLTEEEVLQSRARVVGTA